MGRFFLGACLRLIRKAELEGYVQVGFSTRAHAYIVNGPYIKTLYENYLKTLDSMKEHLFHHTCPTLGLDVQWKAPQLKDRGLQDRRCRLIKSTTLVILRKLKGVSIPFLIQSSNFFLFYLVPSHHNKHKTSNVSLSHQNSPCTY